MARINFTKSQARAWYKRQRGYKKAKKRTYKIAKRAIYNTAETKYFQQTFTMLNAAQNSGPLSFMNAIQVGSANNNRVGNKLHVTNIYGRMTIQPTSGTSVNANGDVIRIVIVRFNVSYRLASGAFPYLANQDEIFVSPGSSIYTVAPRNPDYLDPYTILYDDTFPMTQISATACGPQYVRDFKIRVNKTFTFTDTAGTDNTSSNAMIGQDIVMFAYQRAAGCCAASAYVTTCYKDI